MAIASAILLIVAVSVAVYTDVRDGKIYNALTVPCAAAGLLLSAVSGGWEGLVQSLLGIALGFGLFLFSSLFGRILGGGDIKLLMAIGAIQGARFLVMTIIFMAIAGGVLAILVALWRRDCLASLRRLAGGILMRVYTRTPVDIGDASASARLPYAIPIALGSLMALGYPYLVR